MLRPSSSLSSSITSELFELCQLWSLHPRALACTGLLSAALAFVGTSCDHRQPVSVLGEEDLNKMVSNRKPDRQNFRTASVEGFSCECWLDGILGTPVSTFDLTIVLHVPENRKITELKLLTTISWDPTLRLAPMLLERSLPVEDFTVATAKPGVVDYSIVLKNVFENDLDRRAMPLGIHSYTVSLKVNKSYEFRFQAASITIKYIAK